MVEAKPKRRTLCIEAILQTFAGKADARLSRREASTASLWYGRYPVPGLCVLSDTWLPFRVEKLVSVGNKAAINSGLGYGKHHSGMSISLASHWESCFFFRKGRDLIRVQLMVVDYDEVAGEAAKDTVGTNAESVPIVQYQPVMTSDKLPAM